MAVSCDNPSGVIPAPREKDGSPFPAILLFQSPTRVDPWPCIARLSRRGNRPSSKSGPREAKVCVVIADQGDVIRNPQPILPQHSHCPSGHVVIRAEDRIRRKILQNAFHGERPARDGKITVALRDLLNSCRHQPLKKSANPPSIERDGSSLITI